MTASQLIQLLSEFKPETEVLISHKYGGFRSITIDKEHVELDDRIWYESENDDDPLAIIVS